MIPNPNGRPKRKGVRGFSAKKWLARHPGVKRPTERATLGPYVRWLVIVLAIELLFALCIPETVLTDWPLLARWTALVSTFFPAVEHFDKITAHPEIIRFYLSATPLFILPKIYIAYRWLSSDYLGTYRHLVLSPITTYQPAGIGEFYTGGVSSTKPRAGESGKPRSLFARFVGSLIFMCLCLAVGFMWSIWGWDIQQPPILSVFKASYPRFARGGFWMWFEWNRWSVCVAGFLAIAYCIARDYVRWIRMLLIALIRRVTS